MRVAILNDTHIGSRNGSDIFLNDSERFFRDVFFPYLEENGIDRIIHLGDYFDNRKVISVKALKRQREFFISEIQKRNIEVHIIPGNHDCFYKNTNSVCSLNEHLSLIDQVKVYNKPEVINFDGLDIAMLPWVCDENIDESLEFLKTAEAPILCGHLELEGFRLMAGVSLKSHGMDRKLFSRFEKVLTGHFHTKSSQDNIHYLGTQVQLTWSDANDPKFFHVLDTETREVSEVENPNKVFHTFQYDDSDGFEIPDLCNIEDGFVRVIVIKKKDNSLFEKFIDSINDADPHDLKISDNFEDFSGESVDDEDINLIDTTSLIDSYIESIETELDKTKLKKKLYTLYREAQSMNSI
jgi:DNA repair exonuclease SbcCD nuclease subunit